MSGTYVPKVKQNSIKQMHMRYFYNFRGPKEIFGGPKNQLPQFIRICLDLDLSHFRLEARCHNFFRDPIKNNRKLVSN